MENLGALQELSTPVGLDRWGEGRVGPSAFAQELGQKLQFLSLLCWRHPQPLTMLPGVAYSRDSMENLGASQELSTPVGLDRWGEGRVGASAFAQERSRLRLSGGSAPGMRRSRSFNPSPTAQVSDMHLQYV